ncbi:MAG: AmmeMemoRadiSam system protein B, partial [Thermoguttaceae bacterium]|nr:AmmeMemoRadiSam system protein B [Thermoguttaceae bacterium]
MTMARHHWQRAAALLMIVALGCTRQAGESPSRVAGQETAEASADPVAAKHDRLDEARCQARPRGPVREAAVAGLFYPAQRERLLKQVDDLLAQAKPAGIGGRLRALVAPHAGYEYSGPTAAIAYRQLAGLDVRTVVVMAPSHGAVFRGVFVPEAAAYETPLGRIGVAVLADDLAAHAPFTARPQAQVARPGWARQSPRPVPPEGAETPDTWEHSLEVQLPFLQRVGAKWTLVPLLFGDADAKEVATTLAEHLDETTFVVASSDLSHYLPEDEAKKLDQACIEAICRLDADAIRPEQACGRLPVRTLIHLARRQGWKAKLLDYRTSGDATGDRSAVVGYAAVAFFEPSDRHEAGPRGEANEAGPASRTLSPDERDFLLRLARKTVEAAARGRPIERPEPRGLSPAL